MVQSLPTADEGARAHARVHGRRRLPQTGGGPERSPHPHLAHGRRPVGHARGRRGACRGARVPERMRTPWSTRRADAAPAAARLRPRQPACRAAAAVRPPRPRAEPRVVGAGRAPGCAVRGDRGRACALAGTSPASGRVRRDPRAHHARCLRAPAPRQPLARAHHARGNGRALRRPSRRGRRGRAPRGGAAVRSHERSRLPLSRRRGRIGRPDARRGVRRAL